jgi:hypothetical protein
MVILSLILEQINFIHSKVALRVKERIRLDTSTSCLRYPVDGMDLYRSDPTHRNEYEPSQIKVCLA